MLHMESDGQSCSVSASHCSRGCASRNRMSLARGSPALNTDASSPGVKKTCNTTINRGGRRNKCLEATPVAD
jgi:hypothetical protein